jgi:hypothetical protein
LPSPTDNNAKVFFDGTIDVLRPYVEKGSLVIVGPAPLKSSDAAFTKITTRNWRADIAKARMENLLNNDAKSASSTPFSPRTTPSPARSSRPAPPTRSTRRSSPSSPARTVKLPPSPPSATGSRT